MRSPSSKPTGPVSRASSRAPRRKSARRWWSSRDEPSPPKHGPRIAPAPRSRSPCRCRAAGTTPWRSRSAWRACFRRATHGLRVALGFAVPTIVLVTLLVHLTVRQLLGQPLRAILQTMEETREGNLRARATLTRRDELGTIATRTERDARSAGAVQPVAARAESRRRHATCHSAMRNWPPARASCSPCENRWAAPSGSRRSVRSPPTSPTRRARR